MQEKSPLRLLSGRYLKWTAYGLLLLCAALLQAGAVFPVVFGARPLLLVPAVMMIAMFEGPVGGASAGIGAGLLWDLYADQLWGFHALLLLILGCACGLLVRLLMRNNILSALLLSAGALLVQGLADWFFYTILLMAEEPLYVLIRIILPNALYSWVLAPALYALTLLIAKTLRNRE